jgi:hypothetical protein
VTDPSSDRPLSVEQLFLCEGMRTNDDGRPVFVGIISRGVVPRLPCVPDAFCVSVELWGAPDQEIPLLLRIHAPDGTVVCEEDVGVITLDGDGTRSFGGMFQDVRFEDEGMHALALWSKDRLLRERRFLVDVAPREAGLSL